MCALVTGVQTCALPIYVAQFSGFHKFCENFPYDFVEKKASERESGLSMAYIAISKVSDQIQNRVFNRPLAHKAKLDLVKSRLSSFQRSEEHTSELQSLMRISYAVFCLKKKNKTQQIQLMLQTVHTKVTLTTTESVNQRKKNT